MTRPEDIYAWLEAYTECLSLGAEQLEQGVVPGSEHSARCQDFDTKLRDFDVEVVQRALVSSRGDSLRKKLDDASQRFEKAISGQREDLLKERRANQKAREAMRGYLDAGEHQRLGPLYFEKLL